ncbi:thiamine pyrophosphokinase [Musa troglodytarum]|uniref:thiamine diphosphokinase n=1 Tax=Musa troglodytarum TaxID=320322 RepID=A0A9E7EI63_9LILI|nr:thiamine pyrophosphokinase [Musa troglodytarum]
MEVMRHASTFLRPPPLTPAADGPPLTYALVVLNQRLPWFAPVLWSHGERIFVPPSLPLSPPSLATLRVFADGGANRVYDGMPRLFPEQDPLEVRRRYKPDLIRGDMDSIRPEVKEFYSNLLCILVSGALGGRFDHEAGNINVLYKFSNTRIVLLSDDCLIQLLPRTHCHEIHIQSSVVGPHCGLIPLGAPSASTTTTGLQWDLTSKDVEANKLTSYDVTFEFHGGGIKDF